MTGLHKGQNTSKNCELFQDVPNLAELPFVRYALQSKVPMSATTSRLLQDCDPMLPTRIIFLLTRITFKTFQAKRKDASLCFWSCFWFCHTLFCHASSDTIYSKDKNFGFYNSFPTFLGQKMKFTIHYYYSSVTIHCYYSLSLFTCHYSLRIFAYLRGVVPYI